MSIKDRIAALNLEEIHAPEPSSRPVYTYEQAAGKKRPPPPPPPSQRPQVQQRQHTINNPPGPTSAKQYGNQPLAARPDTPKISPALPPRPPPRTNSQQTPTLPPRTSARPSPSLPPRKSSEHSIRRRDSTESVSTIASGISTLSIGSAKTSTSNGHLYQVRAPPYDPSKLPPLPPKNAPEEPKQSQATLRAMKSYSSIVPNRTLPPQLPSRPPLPLRQESKVQQNVQPQRSHVLPPPRPSALSLGMNKSTETPPPIPVTRPSVNDTPGLGAPPPIPMASRPNLDAIMASKPKPGASGSCLKCRDFSGPDSHAARYARQTLPSSDVAWLSAQLTSPFPSSTDKARAIFTWLHHNIEYDVNTFFNGTCRGSTPEGTITSGLAVCSGYAGLFTALALKAGLESVVVSGHGKGYGHAPLKHGDPMPPFNAGHAWNAVRIDNGEWKLIDPCWGAGNVKGRDTYEKSFKADMFTMDNNDFGYKHFPSDNAYFFRTDGRTSITWEEYLMDDMGERLTVYGSTSSDHGIAERTFQPAPKHIKVYDPQNGPVIRFQFATLCSHWDNERHGKGKPYVMILQVGGRDGRSSDYLPFQTDGRVWWLDVNRVDLGAPGQKVNVYAVTSVGGQDARGLGYAEYKASKGKKAMGFGGVAMWELV